MSTTKTTQLLGSIKRQATFRWVKRLAQLLPRAEIYLVGGGVRDLILGRPTTDFDFVVRGASQDRLGEVLAKFGRVDFVGRRFGVFKLMPRGSKTTYDIALPRTERSRRQQGKHRDFIIHSNSRLTIEEDLKRRDFTINAMAYGWQAGRLVDPHGGLADLGRETIRTVGAPAARFREDYIRMLRAVRLAVELDFEIAPATIAAIKRLAPKLTAPDVPREPMARELTRALAAAPLKTIDYLDLTGLGKTLLPEVWQLKTVKLPGRRTLWDQGRAVIETLRSPGFAKTFRKKAPPSLTLVLAGWWHNIAQTSSTWQQATVLPEPSAAAIRLADRLRLSAGAPGVDTKHLGWLIRNYYRVFDRQTVAGPAVTLEKYFFNPIDPEHELLRLGISVALSYRSLKPSWVTQARHLRQRLKALAPRGQVPQPLITGADVIKLGVPSGVRIAQLLTAVREAQLTRKVKTRSRALTLLQSLVKQR